MFVFTRRRDEPFSLVATTESQGGPSFEHYATVVPVKIRGRQVEACFLTRWDTQVRRVRAIHAADRPLARPGDTGYRRFRNLKLTMSPDDPVLITRPIAGAETMGDVGLAAAASDVIIRLVATRSGRAEFSVVAASDHVVDLTEFDLERGLQIRDVLQRLNHGDVWDRVANL
jgi:hypothetical protein